MRPFWKVREIFYDGWKEDYTELFTKVLKNIDIKNLHSITFGKLRFPETIYKKLIKENISESLFFNLEKKKNMYENSNGYEIESFLRENLTKFFDEKKIFFNN